MILYIYYTSACVRCVCEPMELSGWRIGLASRGEERSIQYRPRSCAAVFSRSTHQRKRSSEFDESRACVLAGVDSCVCLHALCESAVFLAYLYSRVWLLGARAIIVSAKESSTHDDDI